MHLLKCWKDRFKVIRNPTINDFHPYFYTTPAQLSTWGNFQNGVYGAIVYPLKTPVCCAHVYKADNGDIVKPWSFLKALPYFHQYFS